MKKINLKVRLKNPAFWLTFIPAVVSFVYSFLAVTSDTIPKISENELLNIITPIVTALTTLGVLVDPTSKGICDCEHCMNLNDPKK